MSQRACLLLPTGGAIRIIEYYMWENLIWLWFSNKCPSFSLLYKNWAKKRPFTPERRTLHARLGPTCALKHNKRNQITTLTCQQNKETPGQHAAAPIPWNFTAKSGAPLWLEGKPSEWIIRKDGGSTPTAAPTGCGYKEHRCLNRAPSVSWLSHVCHLFIYVKGLTVLRSTIMFMFRCITQKNNIKKSLGFSAAHSGQLYNLFYLFISFPFLFLDFVSLSKIDFLWCPFH